MEALADFFISRAGADAPFAEAIGDAIETAGHRVLLQQWGFANSNFMERMHAALSSGARVIALLSNEYLTSEHCAAEWLNAIAADPLNANGRLIVLRVNECMPRGLLSALAYRDLAPIRNQPDLVREVVLSAIKPGRHKGDGSAAQYWRAARTVVHPEIRSTPSFTGRAGEFVRIGSALRSGETAAVTQPATVHGLAGLVNRRLPANTPIGSRRGTPACGGSTLRGERAAGPGKASRRASSILAASCLPCVSCSAISSRRRLDHIVHYRLSKNFDGGAVLFAPSWLPQLRPMRRAMVALPMT